MITEFAPADTTLNTYSQGRIVLRKGIVVHSTPSVCLAAVVIQIISVLRHLAMNYSIKLVLFGESMNTIFTPALSNTIVMILRRRRQKEVLCSCFGVVQRVPSIFSFFLGVQQRADVI